MIFGGNGCVATFDLVKIFEGREKKWAISDGGTVFSGVQSILIPHPKSGGRNGDIKWNDPNLLLTIRR